MRQFPSVLRDRRENAHAHARAVNVELELLALYDPLKGATTEIRRAGLAREFSDEASDTINGYLVDLRRPGMLPEVRIFCHVDGTARIIVRGLGYAECSWLETFPLLRELGQTLEERSAEPRLK